MEKTKKETFVKIFFIFFTLWLIAVIMSYIIIWNMISRKNNFFISSETKIIERKR